MTPLAMPSEYLPRYRCPSCDHPLTYATPNVTPHTVPVACHHCHRHWILETQITGPHPETGARGSIAFHLRNVH